MVDELFMGITSAGNHIAIWDADKMTSGIYFIKMKAGEFIQITKCTLLK